MPNINDELDFDTFEPVQLHAIYRDLIAKGSIADLPDSDLHIACAILKSLRKKSSGPPARKSAQRSQRAQRAQRSPIIASEDSL